MKAGVLSPLGGERHLAGACFLIFAAICLSLILSPAGLAGSQGKDNKDNKDKQAVEDCDVTNFGKINDHLYRGGQPEGEEYGKLAALGIKTVIDLREDAKVIAHLLTEKAGMRYVNIPLNAKRPPTLEESGKFLSIVNDQTNWPVFVHCAGGRHRTGVLIAIYRMEMNGWNASEAFKEMKNFKFYSRFGHGEMKDYVYEYYRKIGERRLEADSALRARRVVEPSQ